MLPPTRVLSLREAEGAKERAMSTINCPACKTTLSVDEKNMRGGFTMWCSECGQKLRLEVLQGIGAPDTVFPTFAADETLLDMGDTNFLPHPPKP